MEPHSLENRLAQLKGWTIPDVSHSSPLSLDQQLTGMLAIHARLKTENERRLLRALHQNEADPDFTLQELQEMKSNLEKAGADLQCAKHHNTQRKRREYYMYTILLIHTLLSWPWLAGSMGFFTGYAVARWIQ